MRDGGRPAGARRRLLMNYGTRDLDEFARVAQAAAARLGDRWEVRFVVSQLAAKDRSLRTDPEDPYLEYAANFPDVFHFAVPDAVRPEVDPAAVEPHVALAQRKLAILGDLGLGGAFLGREPALLPARTLERLPHWRGPRVDHPRRSKHPVWAPCFHQPEVQAAYRDALAELHGRLPGIDTFFWWTNDSGSGFCWYPYAYAGPNGPSACRDLGPIPAMAAFHSAIVDSARAAGAPDPMSIMTQTKIWDDARMPDGAYRYPPSDGGVGAASIRSEISLTYPVHALWDPVGRVEQLAAIDQGSSVAVMWWLGDVYHRASSDATSVIEQIDLLAAVGAEPERTRHVRGRLSIVADLASRSYGAAAADDVVDGWDRLHAALATQVAQPFRTPLIAFLPTYGPVSHRWLTRPLVAFPAELTADEESWYLPHVFAVGDSARRENLLDLHGYAAALPGEAPDLRSAYYTSIVADLVAAGDHLERAANAADADGATRLASNAAAARALACVWATIRNWTEFGALLARGVEGTVIPGDQRGLADADAYRRSLFAILREELDNTQRLADLLAGDRGCALTTAADAADEDAFTLGPDLLGQLSRKRDVILAHWQDVARLVPLEAA